MKVKVNILHVFTDSTGKFGNPVGIVVDEKQELSSKNRQSIASKIGFSESVFINDLKVGNVSIFNPVKEVEFAGHALIGTAYFVSQILKEKLSTLDCKGGLIKFWQEGQITWIQANLMGTPPWHHEQFQEPALIDKLTVSEMATKEHVVVWAWVDKNMGIIRARTFANDWGIPEDQGNGSGSMQLAVSLNQKLEIHHGEGSVIYAKPESEGVANIGGRVKINIAREIVIDE